VALKAASEITYDSAPELTSSFDNTKAKIKRCFEQYNARIRPAWRIHTKLI
jgi:hypothetical protein